MQRTREEMHAELVCANAMLKQEQKSNDALHAEVERWKSLEEERKQAVLQMTGDIPSIERLVVKFTEAKQEVERLRAALKEIVDFDKRYVLWGRDHEMHEIARAALEVKS